jgi:hypothetical protein
LLFDLNDGLHQAARFRDGLFFPVNANLFAFELGRMVEVRLNRFVGTKDDEGIVVTLLVLNLEMRVIALLDADEGTVGGASSWRGCEGKWSSGGKANEEKGSTDKAERGHAVMATGAGAKRKPRLRELCLLFKSPPLNSGRSLQHAPRNMTDANVGFPL